MTPMIPLAEKPRAESPGPAPAAAAPKLDVSDLNFYYGTQQALFDVSLRFPRTA